MLEELRALLDYVVDPTATRDDYRKAIVAENCLGKRSGETRSLTAKHLVSLYALDPAAPVFRAMLYFWRRDADTRPLLALLCAYTRDALLRVSAPFVVRLSQGDTLDRQKMEDFLEAAVPGRFSAVTLQSTAKNLNSTWTQSGHLVGRVQKVRTQVVATPGSFAYATLLGYLTGVRGQSLFETEYCKLLDCPAGRAVELAEAASRRGWMVFKRVGDVVEALFPNLLTAEEMEWVREQS